MFSFVKNKELITPLTNSPHAFARYKIDAKKYPLELIEEIAIGQSLGAWETRYVDVTILREKVAKIVDIEITNEFYSVTLAFPECLWHKKLSWLLTILYGKMSFYEGVTLNSVWFSQNCFDDETLIGPRYDMNSLRELVNPEFSPRKATHNNTLSKPFPLLMGILKPCVAMNHEKIASLYVEAAEAGLHILKDDEIRFDTSIKEVLKRVEMIANEAAKRNLKTLYAVHLQIDSQHFIENALTLKNAGASAILINTWTAGIDTLQVLRKHISIPILSHPALIGAFGITNTSATIHPRVTLAQFIRAAGADLSLFPSPYGKLGLEKSIALDIAKNCLTKEGDWHIKETIPVPSAGIKPEHASIAIKDFGTDFVLNAGTGIFSHSLGIKKAIEEFKNELKV